MILGQEKHFHWKWLNGAKLLSLQPMKTIAFHTLGCKLNYSETSTLSRMMEKEGMQKVDFTDFADVYVINTCSVTENADKECRMLVRQIQRKAPDAAVVITGCYAQLKPTEIAEIEGVDMVLGAAEKFNIVEHLKNFEKKEKASVYSCDIDDVNIFNSSYSFGDRTRSFLKVQDGCDYSCSFCTIPMARGASRSDTIENAVKKSNEIAALGVKEIVLTGVNLGDFKNKSEVPLPLSIGEGQGVRSNGEDFFQLIQQLDKVEGIERYRISSIEPNLLTDEIIDFVAQSKRFMPHFHVPLQSGSNKLLKLMRRRYQRELYVKRVEKIKAVMPHACIGVDVIVGFPDETDNDFLDTYNFLNDLDVSYLHVFTYSERPNTLAAEMPNAVPMHIRKQRNQALRNLSLKKMNFFQEQFMGSTRKVLFEHENKNGLIEGYADNYLRISAPFNETLINTIVEQRIEGNIVL
ncbi:MAG: tRNA ((6)-L-threonylcarbamoyladenosine(37)-C(2))-methylthiotransferase MtaB [Bacteroidota bacterium]|jgi:threonylcarbamoyladenosine tRNA methylthiotransferase MtaB